MVEFNYADVCPICGGKIVKIGGCTQCANGCGFVGSCENWTRWFIMADRDGTGPRKRSPKPSERKGGNRNGDC